MQLISGREDRTREASCAGTRGSGRLLVCDEDDVLRACRPACALDEHGEELR